MRHQYTPIFRDLLTSSLWASTSASTRCVWMTLLLLADPEGYVPAAAPGLALAANVSIEECRAALAQLEAPDPDSRTPDFDGRRIEKVDHGWRILNFVAWRERAKHEAEKARQRTWAKQHRAKKRPQPANDNGVDASALHVAESSETVDAPKPKPKPSLSEEGSPLPPEGDFVEIIPREAFLDVGKLATFDAPVLPLVLHELPEHWVMSDELRAEAVMAGVPADDIDRRIADLRTGTIGGQRGVLSHKVDDYVRQQFGKWRTWAEGDRAKAQRAAQAPPGRAFGGGRGSVPLLEPNAKHVAFAEAHGVDLGAIVRRLNGDNVVEALGVVGARKELEKALSVAARERALERARATG
jgi:hypothetical protein